MQADQEAKLQLSFLVREYFIRDVIKQQQNGGGMQFGSTYRLGGRGRRTHHLEAVYLLIYYNLSSNILNPREMELFFSTCLRPGLANEQQIFDIVRVWMYYIRPSDRIEAQIIGIAADNYKTGVRERKEKIKQYESEWLLERHEDPATVQLMKDAPTLYTEIFHQVVQAFTDGQGYSGRQLSFS